MCPVTVRGDLDATRHFVHVVLVPLLVSRFTSGDIRCHDQFFTNTIPTVYTSSNFTDSIVGIVVEINSNYGRQRFRYKGSSGCVPRLESETGFYGCKFDHFYSAPYEI